MNDMRNDRKANLRHVRRSGLAQRAIPRAMLVGTIAVLMAMSAAHAQDPRISRAGLNQDSGYGYPPAGAAQPVFVEPGYGSYGWNDSLPADCGLGCAPTWRTRFEALMYNREGDSNASLSTGFRLNDFDYEEGGRVTIGRKYDCAMGWEVVYTGHFEWENFGVVNGAGTLNTSLQPGGAVNLSAFQGANQHAQVFRSRYQSVEAVEKWWGWDVITTSAGIRYIGVDEDYAFRSVDANNDIGLFTISVDNHLIGPQLGIDLLYPIDRVSFDGTLKGGLFANIADSDTILSNAGVIQFANSAEDVEFAAMIEWGTYIRFALTPRINLRAGYEILWIYGLGIAVDQIRNPIHTLTGRSLDGTGDTLYHGGTVGVEIIW
jgi:hypothetical protein